MLCGKIYIFCPSEDFAAEEDFLKLPKGEWKNSARGLCAGIRACIQLPLTSIVRPVKMQQHLPAPDTSWTGNIWSLNLHRNVLATCMVLGMYRLIPTDTKTNKTWFLFLRTLNSGTGITRFSTII